MREGKERRDGERYKTQDLETGEEKLACIAHLPGLNPFVSTHA